MKTSTDFFLSGRSIPAWVCGLAFISANLGAQEVIGMGACGAKYGIDHEPLLLAGRDPGDGLRRHLHDAVLLRLAGPLVPEYLKLRFDEKTRGFNAISFAVMTVFSSGISMYAMAKMISVAIFDARSAMGWLRRIFSILVSAIIVLVYIFLGGLTSGDLQRSVAVLPDRRGLPAAGVAWD